MREMLYGLSNLMSLAAAAGMVFAALLALRQVGGGGAVLLMIGSIGQLILSLFWTMVNLGNIIDLPFLDSLGSEVFASVSVLSSGIFLMWAVGLILVLLKVGAILRHRAVEDQIRAGQAG